jgi:hypothetical protein
MDKTLQADSPAQNTEKPRSTTCSTCTVKCMSKQNQIAQLGASSKNASSARDSLQPEGLITTRRTVFTEKSEFSRAHPPRKQVIVLLTARQSRMSITQGNQWLRNASPTSSRRRHRSSDRKVRKDSMSKQQMKTSSTTFRLKIRIHNHYQLNSTDHHNNHELAI